MNQRQRNLENINTGIQIEALKHRKTKDYVDFEIWDVKFLECIYSLDKGHIHSNEVASLADLRVCRIKKSKKLMTLFSDMPSTESKSLIIVELQLNRV